MTLQKYNKFRMCDWCLKKKLRITIQTVISSNFANRHFCSFLAGRDHLSRHTPTAASSHARSSSMASFCCWKMGILCRSNVAGILRRNFLRPRRQIRIQNRSTNKWRTLGIRIRHTAVLPICCNRKWGRCMYSFSSYWWSFDGAKIE